jgi:hypothetical protein
MAIYKIFPSKDATLYTEYPTMNTGLDEILEASTYIKNGDDQVSRYLIQFTDNDINSIINNRISGASFKTYLKNYKAIITGLNLDTTLEIYPISGSWGMGTGRFENSPITTNGTSWTWRDYEGGNQWSTSSFSPYVTASFSGTTGGGTWYTGSSLGLNIIHTQSFSYSDPLDLNVDVTNTVLNWYSSSIVNDGFIVKQYSTSEFSQNDANTTFMKFFSIDTHTIYPPYLEFRWDDYIFNTGSSSSTITTTSNILLSLDSNIGTYYSGSIQKFRLNVAQKYPPRTYSTSSGYTVNYYLPQGSTYAVKDTKTNEYIIDFDNTYTRISADSTGNHFTLYMDGFEPERYYTVLIKTTIDGSTLIHDQDLTFKVVNG